MKTHFLLAIGTAWNLSLECEGSWNILTAECGNFLNLLPLQAEETAPLDDSFEGHPGGAYRGLAVAILFHLLLLFVAVFLLWADRR